MDRLIAGGLAGAGAGVVEWAVAAAPLAGMAVSGDRHLVAPYPGGVLLAVVDALGHGPAADEVATLAVATLAEDPGRDPVTLARHCDGALRGGRGAVLALASIADDGNMVWLGVGNVEATVLAATGERASLTARAGIVGSNPAGLRPAALRLDPGDRLVLVTDGIREGQAEAVRGAADLGTASAMLLDRRKGDDDALALVARYLGAGSAGAGAGPRQRAEAWR